MENNIVWKICPIADFFEVSTNGDVRLATRKRTKTPSDNGNGYLYVSKVTNGKAKHYYVHRLVAATFLENPMNYTEVNHKDGDKKNNNVANLEWCSRGHNVQHAYKTGLRVISEQHREASRRNVYKSIPFRKAGWEKWNAKPKDPRNHPMYKDIPIGELAQKVASGETVQTVCQQYNISKYTYYKKLKERGIK